MGKAKKGMKTMEFEFPDPDAEDGDVLDIEPAENTVYNVLEEKYEKPEPEEDEDESKAEVEVEEEVVEEDTIEVIDDTPDGDKGREVTLDSPETAEVTEKELTEYGKKVQDRMKRLNKGLHDQRRFAEQAVRERDEMEKYARGVIDENQKLKTTSSTTRNSLITQAKKAAEAEADFAEQELTTAYEVGEGDKIAAAQRKLTSAQVKLERVNSIRPNPLPNQKPALQTEATDVQIPQQVPAPQPQVDEKALKWAEKNVWFETDEEMRDVALIYHNKLKRQGMDLRSDAYYKKLDVHIREEFPEEFDIEPEKPKAKEESDDSVVAPVTRSTAPRKYTLTKSQVAIAKRLNVPLKEYAKQAAELERG